MELFEALHTRRSIRAFTDQPLSEADLETMLRAAMDAPSAVNAQPWHFVVITDRAMLDAIPDIHPHAAMCRTAQAAIVSVADNLADQPVRQQHSLRMIDEALREEFEAGQVPELAPRILVWRGGELVYKSPEAPSGIRSAGPEQMEVVYEGTSQEGYLPPISYNELVEAGIDFDLEGEHEVTLADGSKHIARPVWSYLAKSVADCTPGDFGALSLREAITG